MLRLVLSPAIVITVVVR